MVSFRDMPIRRKLVWITLLVTGTALLASGIAESVFDLATFRSRAVEEQLAIADLVGISSVPALEFNDPRTAEETLATLKARPDVLVAAIYAASGEVFASYVRDPAYHALRPLHPKARGHRFEGGHLELTQPLADRRKPLGTIYLRTDVTPVYRRMYFDMAIRGVFLVAAFLLAIAATPLVQRFVSRPILGLAHVARAVTAKKDYTRRAASLGRDEIGQLTDDFNQMLEAIQEANREKDSLLADLEQRVAERTASLAAANKELETFSYSVSHDLRAPLRAMDGFSQALLEDCAGELDPRGVEYLQRIRRATVKMNLLIDDLLKLSRVTRAELRREEVDVTALAKSVVEDLRSAQPHRDVAVSIVEGMSAEADPSLLRVVLENLLGNAWKFTSTRAQAIVEVGILHRDGKPIFFVYDNGVGFDMAFADKLFGAFQRLHSQTAFPGTGIGLATVQRIITRHGGQVRAESAVDKGATFYFTLS